MELELRLKNVTSGTTHLLVVVVGQLLVEDDREQVKMNGLQINGAAILLLLFHND